MGGVIQSALISVEIYFFKENKSSISVSTKKQQKNH